MAKRSGSKVEPTGLYDMIRNHTQHAIFDGFEAITLILKALQWNSYLSLVSFFLFLCISEVPFSMFEVCFSPMLIMLYLHDDRCNVHHQPSTWQTSTCMLRLRAHLKHLAYPSRLVSPATTSTRAMSTAAPSTTSTPRRIRILMLHG